MEDTLRVIPDALKRKVICLNPCFNGRYSQSQVLMSLTTTDEVLILVLMEDTLREQ